MVFYITPQLLYENVQYITLLMSGVKHVIESSFAYISKPLHRMMMSDSKIAMEKLKKMLTEKDRDEMENENQLKMKQGEMKLSKFGFGFELTGFLAFLSWTGMGLFSLLGLVSVLLIALPMEPYFQNLWQEEFHKTDKYSFFETIYILMQVFGSVFLVIAVGYFIMNFFLRKKNRDNNFNGVKKMLKVICSISAVLAILLFSFDLIMITYNIMNGIFMPTHGFAIVYIPALVFWCLLLHGIRKERSGFVKAFLVFQYTIFGLITACIGISSVGSAVGYGMFIIFPCGLLLIMIYTFLFIFNIGFYVALHSIYLENEKTQQQKKKNIEFINASFENC